MEKEKKSFVVHPSIHPSKERVSNQIILCQFDSIEFLHFPARFNLIMNQRQQQQQHHTAARSINKSKAAGVYETKKEFFMLRNSFVFDVVDVVVIVVIVRVIKRPKKSVTRVFDHLSTFYSFLLKLK